MQDRGHELLAVGVVFLTASWGIFLLRFCSRLRLVKHFKVDDWSLIIVQVCVGIFLLRIAINRSHLLVLHILTWGTLVVGIPYAFLMALRCRPIDTFWNVSPQTPGQCWDYRLMGVLIHIASALNCFADWVFGVIPFFIVRSLNITRPTKALVAWVLCFAAMWVKTPLTHLVAGHTDTVRYSGSIATIVRTFFLPRMLSVHDFLSYTYRTYQDDTVDLCIWSTVEVGVGVLAWSAATCRPIHRYFLARIKAWPWMSACRTCQRRPESRDPFADGPAREIKLRPDEYCHESRCSSNGGGSASRTAKCKGSVFTVREVSEPLSVAEEGGITRTMELTQISTSRRGALFPVPPDTALMPSHLPARLSAIPRQTRVLQLGTALCYRAHKVHEERARVLLAQKHLRILSCHREQVSSCTFQDTRPIAAASHERKHRQRPLPHLVRAYQGLPPPPIPGLEHPHHGSTSASASASPNCSSSKTNNTNPRSTDDTLVFPRQSVASFDGEENDSGSLRWSTASESSYYNSGHDQLRDTFEPLGLSAPPRAAFLRRCSHMKPPVFQPIKWRRSRDSTNHRASSSANRLSVFAPPPLPVGKTHSMREFGQWSPTAVRAPSRKSGYGYGYGYGYGDGSSRFSTILDDEGEREESGI
ncbi:Integral membrane protein [Apiospora saccharicola]